MILSVLLKDLFAVDELRVIAVTTSEVCVLSREKLTLARHRRLQNSVVPYGNFGVQSRFTPSDLASLIAADLRSIDDKVYMGLGDSHGKVTVLEITSNHRQESVIQSIKTWQATDLGSQILTLQISTLGSCIPV